MRCGAKGSGGEYRAVESMAFRAADRDQLPSGTASLVWSSGLVRQRPPRIRFGDVYRRRH